MFEMFAPICTTLMRLGGELLPIRSWHSGFAEFSHRAPRAEQPSRRSQRRIRATNSEVRKGKGSSVFREQGSARRYYVLMLAIAAVSMWIRGGFPIYAIGPAAYDDQLFVRTARFLESGQWLGPYDSLTLIKGMFYPLFIVVAFWTSIPLKIFEHAVYLLAAALAARLVQRQAGSYQAGLALFALLSFNPVFWSINLARIVREGVYITLCLVLVVLVVMICFPMDRQQARSIGRTTVLGISLGLVSGAYWFTREEGIWLTPAIAVVVVIGSLRALRTNRTADPETESVPSRSAQVRAILTPLGLALVVFMASDVFVAGMNYRHYGIFETNEFRSKSFLRAYGAISRIRHDTWQRYVSFPKDARQRAYAVSPAARELANSFEGSTGKTWLQITCARVNTQPCDEVQSGWMVWELRNAVSDAGHYRSAPEAMKFYEALADQIDAACDHKTISCLPRRATMQPPFRWEYLGETIQAAKPVARAALTLGDGQIGSASSMGSTEELAIFTDTVGDIHTIDGGTRLIRGWVASESDTPKIQLVPRTSQHVESSLTLLPAPDVVAAHPELKSVRFEMKTECPPGDCDVIVSTGTGSLTILLQRILQKVGISEAGFRVQIDNVVSPPNATFTNSRRALQVKIAAAIALVYRSVMPILAVIGTAGLLVACCSRRAPPLPAAVLAFGLASLTAVGCRIAMIAYINATSFPVSNDLLYTSPASPFVITLATIGTYAWFRILRGNGRSVEA